MESPSQNAEMYIGKNCYKHYIWDMIHDIVTNNDIDFDLQ